MSGARAGVFVDAFLHQEGGMLIDEIGQRLRIANGRTGTEKSGNLGSKLLEKRVRFRTSNSHGLTNEGDGNLWNFQITSFEFRKYEPIRPGKASSLIRGTKSKSAPRKKTRRTRTPISASYGKIK
jgi:hypothetical protein